MQHEFEPSAEPTIGALLDELRAYPAGATPAEPERDDLGGLAVPLRLKQDLGTATGELAFISTTTVFGTALDLTLAELTIEAFFPADVATAEALRLTAERLSDRSP